MDPWIISGIHEVKTIFIILLRFYLPFSLGWHCIDGGKAKTASVLAWVKAAVLIVLVVTYFLLPCSKKKSQVSLKDVFAEVVKIINFIKSTLEYVSL